VFVPKAGCLGAWPVFRDAIHFTQKYIEAKTITSRHLKPSLLQTRVGRLRIMSGFYKTENFFIFPDDSQNIFL
jgi:hypothetical protein